MKWAVINTHTNLVENVIVWDGISQIFSSAEEYLVQLHDGESCEMNDKYDSQLQPRFTKQLD